MINETSQISDGLARSKRPRNRLAGRYGKPIHPLLVTVPIGAWFASLVFDVCSNIGTPSPFLHATSLWLMGVGILGALAASLFGFLDYLQLPRGSHVAFLGLMHMVLNIGVIGLYVINFVIRLATTPVDNSVSWWLVLLSVMSYGLVGFGGHLGSIMAYRYGVRVADDASQMDAYRSASAGVESRV